MAKKKNFDGAGNDLFGADLFLSPPEIIENKPQELQINPAFKTLIPPLSPDEYTQLEENLLENGIREPISVWKGFIIDGHNRYELALKYGLEFEVVSYEFANEGDVTLWIIRNQLGRRNLDLLTRVEFALLLKPVIAEKAKEKQKRKPLNSVPLNSAEQNSVDTREIIAKEAGVSPDTVSKAETIIKKGSQEVKEKIKRGEMSINKAYQDIKFNEKKKEVAASVSEPTPLTDIDKKFDAIYCDPPYRYNVTEGDDSSPDLHYPTMTVEELKAMGKDIPTETSAILFLWATYPLLPEALSIIEAWGFRL
jgi:ParB-like chromosome segregation protein Spo0J